MHLPVSGIEGDTTTLPVKTLTCQKFMPLFIYPSMARVLSPFS